MFFSVHILINDAHTKRPKTKCPNTKRPKTKRPRTKRPRTRRPMDKTHFHIFGLLQYEYTAVHMLLYYSMWEYFSKYEYITYWTEERVRSDTFQRQHDLKIFVHRNMHFLSFFNMLEPGVSSIAFWTKIILLLLNFTILHLGEPQTTCMHTIWEKSIKSTHPIVISNRTYWTYFSSVSQVKKIPFVAQVLSDLFIGALRWQSD